MSRHHHPYRSSRLFSTFGLRTFKRSLSLKSLDAEITHVVGLDDGRIFMSGQDGAVYELHYQEKDGWFGKRIQLINHSIGGVQSFLPLISSQRSPGTHTEVFRICVR